MGHKENIYQRYLELFKWDIKKIFIKDIWISLDDIKKIFIKDIWSSLDGKRKDSKYLRYLELFRWDIHKGNTYQRYLELFNIGHALRKYLSNLYGQNICYVSGGSIVHC